MKKMALLFGCVLVIGCSNINTVVENKAKNEVKVEQNIERSFLELDAELKSLENKENEKFKEEEKTAKIAEENLNNLKKIKETSITREKVLTSMEQNSIYKEEAGILAKKYREFIVRVNEQEKIEQRKLFEFNQLKSLR